MVVTLPGSFSVLDSRGKAKRGKTAPINICMEGAEVVLFVVDPKTSKVTHRLTVDGGESLVAAVHALETSCW